MNPLTAQQTNPTQTPKSESPGKLCVCVCVRVSVCVIYVFALY